MALRVVSDLPPTYLPESHPDTQARAELTAGVDPYKVAQTYPLSTWAWGVLAMQSIDRGELVGAYAYAHTGYHLGMEQLRKAGWRDGGLVPPGHPPNQGFLLSLEALSLAARELGQGNQANQLDYFLRRCDPNHLAF